MRRAGIGALKRGVVVGFMVMVATLAPAQQSMDLNKPMGDFTIGDLFPKVGGDKSALGQQWKTSGEELVGIAKQRTEAVNQALEVKKQELATIEERLKTAKKNKDMVETGTLEGTLKQEQTVVKILEELKGLTENQLALAEAWRDTGTALMSYAAADKSFDQFRSKKIVKPGEGQADERLGEAGAHALMQHADALDSLSKALGNFASQASKMAGERKALLKSLEKGGNVQSAK